MDLVSFLHTVTRDISFKRARRELLKGIFHMETKNSKDLQCASKVTVISTCAGHVLRAYHKQKQLHPKMFNVVVLPLLDSLAGHWSHL